MFNNRKAAMITLDFSKFLTINQNYNQNQIIVDPKFSNTLLTLNLMTQFESRKNCLISSSLFGSGANKQDSHLIANDFNKQNKQIHINTFEHLIYHFFDLNLLKFSTNVGRNKVILKTLTKCFRRQNFIRFNMAGIRSYLRYIKQHL
ncbi:hypothetical protein DERP_005265 [Dermatophagoides pteronyssinus]|uniref:Uncharacterized protein n=1 Tax=Dermatophagoides pteronyssinus TaxID=6956 RepID=A0ABQ8JM42_DERPT|nr:hypothetical protein DERP_005265 [Dermatophagoides pteronyssinus]